jgi:hypothetical protein
MPPLVPVVGRDGRLSPGGARHTTNFEMLVSATEYQAPDAPRTSVLGESLAIFCHVADADARGLGARSEGIAVLASDITVPSRRAMKAVPRGPQAREEHSPRRRWPVCWLSTNDEDVSAAARRRWSSLRSRRSRLAPTPVSVPTIKPDAPEMGFTLRVGPACY